MDFSQNSNKDFNKCGADLFYGNNIDMSNDIKVKGQSIAWRTRTVVVPITGLRAPFVLFGGRWRGPIFGTPTEIDFVTPVPELSIIADAILGDRIITSVKVKEVKMNYTINYTRIPVISDPLGAGAVVSYSQFDLFNLNSLGSIVSNRSHGIPNVNTWSVSPHNSWFDISIGSEISFLTVENFFTGSTVALMSGNNNLLLTLEYLA